jgi:formyltetrahydrofolate deformylase
MSRFVLTLSCPDRMGIVAAVSTFLASRRCNIVDSAQFGDEDSHRFFMRIQFAADGPTACAALASEFGPIAGTFGMQWALHDLAVRPRLVVLVSRHGHCLNDLLYRFRTGALHATIAAVVSNHPDFGTLTAAHDIRFHYLPVEGGTKARQEGRLLDLVEAEGADLVVLARYMQVLSPLVCDRWRERAINIHHSFLPSFGGAKPYHQAHDRGVKLIGATAHYVTEDLDEGPIIEQDVARVDHSMSVQDLVDVGRDVECLVLARAVKWHVEHRILLNGSRTVVFK